MLAFALLLVLAAHKRRERARLHSVRGAVPFVVLLGRGEGGGVSHLLMCVLGAPAPPPPP